MSCLDLKPTFWKLWLKGQKASFLSFLQPTLFLIGLFARAPVHLGSSLLTMGVVAISKEAFADFICLAQEVALSGGVALLEEVCHCSCGL